MPGAATQIFSPEFDAALARLPKNVAALIMAKIDDMGRRSMERLDSAIQRNDPRSSTGPGQLCLSERVRLYPAGANENTPV
jgi:hypothetical protein